MAGKSREQKLQFIKDFMQGKALAPVTGITYVHNDKVFAYQRAGHRATFEKEEEIPLEQFHKLEKPVTHAVHVVNFSKG